MGSQPRRPQQLLESLDDRQTEQPDIGEREVIAAPGMDTLLQRRFSSSLLPGNHQRQGPEGRVVFRHPIWQRIMFEDL